jgi:hypothetical protein
MGLPTCTIFIYVIDSGIVSDSWTPTIELFLKMVPYNVSINRYDGYVVIIIVINFILLTNDVKLLFL